MRDETRPALVKARAAVTLHEVSFIVMKNMTRAAFTVALLLSGLSTGLPALAQGYPPPPPNLVIVPGAPPPVRVEAVPPPPFPAAWRPGFWR